jgi:BlaI family penicillinase repressor
VQGADENVRCQKLLIRRRPNAIVCSVTASSITDRSTASKPLTELQQAILDFIWSNGDSTADQVREGIARKHPLKESSVRTLLGRLEARGYLAHRVDGKTFVYNATARPAGLAAKAVRNIIERLCAGSVDQFLTGMVDERVLSVEQLERLARKVRNRK